VAASLNALAELLREKHAQTSGADLQTMQTDLLEARAMNDRALAIFTVWTVLFWLIFWFVPTCFTRRSSPPPH
jgi:uncharacterized BrkB/YihY/UPF0761 family membrane protein